MIFQCSRVHRSTPSNFYCCCVWVAGGYWISLDWTGPKTAMRSATRRAPFRTRKWKTKLQQVKNVLQIQQVEPGENARSSGETCSSGGSLALPLFGGSKPVWRLSQSSALDRISAGAQVEATQFRWDHWASGLARNLQFDDGPKGARARNGWQKSEGATVNLWISPAKHNTPLLYITP